MNKYTFNAKDSERGYFSVFAESRDEAERKLLAQFTLDDFVLCMQEPYPHKLHDVACRFDGDVVITDPGYLFDERFGRKSGQVWDDICHHIPGSCIEPRTDILSLSQLGVTPHIVGRTLYGDWGCTVFGKTYDDAKGQFCADGGMFCVLPYQEYLKFQEAIDPVDKEPWERTILHDFHGMIHAIVTQDDTPQQVLGHTYYEQMVHIEGRDDNGGLVFFTRQTGL